MYPQNALRDILILEDEIFLYQRKFSRLASSVAVLDIEREKPSTAEWLQAWTALAGANRLLRNRWKQCRRVAHVRPIQYML